VIEASVSCTGTYTSGDGQPVFASLEYARYSDGSSWGLCWLEHRLDSIISLARLQGNLCQLVDWTTNAPGGGTDLQGELLRMSVTIDINANIVTGDDGLALSPLSCTELDPLTGEPLTP
jgi:hypothetical protein